MPCGMTVIMKSSTSPSLDHPVAGIGPLLDRRNRAPTGPVMLADGGTCQGSFTVWLVELRLTGLGGDLAGIQEVAMPHSSRSGLSAWQWPCHR